MRSSKNFSSTSTRSGARMRTLIFERELKETDAKQSLAVVFAIPGRARRRRHDRRGDAEDFAVVNPRMAGDNAVAFARFQQDRWQ